MQEIAARIPDVSAQYDAWTGESFPSAVLNSLAVDKANGLYKISVAKGGSNEVDSVFPVAHFPDRSVIEERDKLVVETTSANGIFFAQRAGWLNIGVVVLYGPLKSRLYVTPLAACFMVSFVLGMLCRYFPTSWINIARSEKGDAFYPLAARLLDWIEETFPAMTVDLLRGPYDFERDQGSSDSPAN